MLDIYIFETTQLIEQLEQTMLDSEKSNDCMANNIDEIFRIMHTIKGSSAMMHFDNASALAHTLEDVFYFIRENQNASYDHSNLCDIVLESIDFGKIELEKIKSGENTDENVGDIAKKLIERINIFLSELKQSKPIGEYKNINEKSMDTTKQENICDTNYKSYQATIWFQDGCGLDNIRAYGVIHNLKTITEFLNYMPEDIEENDQTIEVIQKQGFKIFLKAKIPYDELYNFLSQTVLLKDLELIEIESVTLDNSGAPIKVEEKNTEEQSAATEHKVSTHQNIISVDVTKLDKLMDLVGEMVIAETMVTQNPDLKNLELDNFQKAARQLRKIHSELQDTVMSIRMVPLATTFFKMQRIVRDMNKKLNKDVGLEIIGEETEVDKNIIEHISDPLMHLIRNAVDHGVGTAEERKSQGKLEPGKVTLEAKNAGGEVLILVKDNGKGLNKEKILERAKQNGLLYKNESEMTDKEIFSLILIPGFSTNDNVTEFSGRGVGMDVVAKSIDVIGGAILIESIPEQGTTITLKIPLTLAIIDGMNVGVGDARYTLAIAAIRESFKASKKDLICDPDGNEMIMLRGECYPVLRLHKQFRLENAKTLITDGIIIVVENDEKTICLFADELLGEQQVVVKALPNYIRNTRKIKCLAGCTLLGDGNISLILDVAECINIGNVSTKKQEQ